MIINRYSELKNAPAEYGNIGSLFEEYVLQKEELRQAKEKAEESDSLNQLFWQICLMR